jgi:hypothetical protein
MPVILPPVERLPSCADIRPRGVPGNGEWSSIRGAPASQLADVLHSLRGASHFGGERVRHPENAFNRLGPVVASYSMSPYAITFKPSYDRGGEKRPIDDLDGEGLTARSVIDAALGGLKQDSLKPRPDDDSKSIRVSSMLAFDEFTFVEVELGRAGLVGNIHPAAGGRVPYGEKDHNGAMVRAILVYVPGAYEVYLLNERASMTSAFSLLEDILVDALRAATNDARLTIKIEPVSEWNAMTAWANQVSVKELRFDAPRPGGSTQALDVNGIHADVQFIVKPKGSLALSRLLGPKGPDRNLVFGFLTELPLVSKRSTPNSLMKNGWKAKVTFRTPSGRQRHFGLATEDRAPTLTYAVGPTGGGVSTARRPGDGEFAAAAAEFLTDVAQPNNRLRSVAESILRNII